jgi:TolA-binding protein
MLMALFLSGTLIQAEKLQAQEDVGSSILLSEKLNELGMYDLSFYLIDQEIAKYPQDKDKLQVQKASIWFAKGKIDEGEKILNTISSSSPAYPFSRLILGIKFVNQGANDKAAKVLEEYFTYKKAHKPDPSNQAEVKEFQKAVAYLRHAYIQLGDSDSATEAIGRMSWLQGSGSAGNENETILLSAQTKLDTAENMIELKEKGWETKVNSVLKPLAGLYWTGATYLTAMAAIERARALCLLGRYDAGLKDLKKYNSLIKGFDSEFKKQGIHYQAPSGKARLWKGYIYIGLAEKSKSPKLKLGFYKKAAGNFIGIFKNYDTNKFPYSDKAVSGFNQVKAGIESLGKKLVLPRGVHLPGGKVNRKQADEMYNKKEYKKAVPLYLDLLRNPTLRYSSAAPDLLYRTIDSLTKTNRHLEALCLAGYLGETFPNDTKYTPLTMLQVGERFWKKYKSAKKGSPEQIDALENAMYIYTIYLKSCPTHELAPDIAIRMAQVTFDRANDIARQVKTMPSLAEKLKKSEEAKKAFAQAIPMYSYIVENYGNSKRGKTSAYLLAICETAAKNYKRGAELFLKYVELERNWKKKSEQEMWRIGDAKLRASQNYFDLASALEKDVKALKKKSKKAPSAKEVGRAKEVGTTSEENKEKIEVADKNATPKEVEVKETEKIQEDPEAVIARIEKPVTSEDYLALADAKKQLAQNYYKLAITNLDELIKWLQPGALVAADHSSKAAQKIPKIKERAYSLIGWAYDGADDVNNAITSFDQFIAAFPNSKLIPKSMLRLGMLYLQKEETTKAADVLDKLSDRFPEEGKKALPKLARALYETEKYDKSIETVTKIFNDKKSSVAISQLRWIAKNLQDCEGRHPKEGAELSLRASEILLEELKKPLLSDWLGKAKAKELQGKNEEIAKALNNIKEQIFMNAGSAAYYAGKYKDTVDYLSRLLENTKTPYFWKAHFLRAEAYIRLKKFQKAITDDFAEMSMTYLSMKQQKQFIYYKIQSKIGDCYVAMNEYGKAAASYNNVTLSLMSSGVDETDKDEISDVAEKAKLTADEKVEEKKWLEYAVFMDACCQNKLGNEKEVQYLIDLYRKNFVQGRYSSQLSSLPSPDDMYKKQYPEINQK